jgi:hypothetical protein
MIHGSPEDRGSADSYYRRPPYPHYYPEGTGRGQRIDEVAMTEKEIADYWYGFHENEKERNWKEWD